jgi:hypothetical protein
VTAPAKSEGLSRARSLQISAGFIGRLEFGRHHAEAGDGTARLPKEAGLDFKE